MTRPRQPPVTPLHTLAELVGDRLRPGSTGLRGPAPASVTGMSLSSQHVLPGDLYAGVPGTRAHGASYAPAAVAAGASAVLTDPDGLAYLAGLDIPVLVVDHPRELLGRIAALVYGDAAGTLALLAVTGTQGKTTTTRLAAEGLQAVGHAAAVIGTVGTKIDGEELAGTLTTPEAPDLHALFAVMRERGVEGCAMEVSSHALVMGRVDGVVFDVAAFTNLGRDHLDFHADLEDYFAAKASLFSPQRSRRGLVNIDDPYGRRLVEQSEIPVRTFSISDPAADWLAEEVTMTPTGSSFRVRTPGGELVPASVALTGDFNVSNALCAVAGLAEAGFDAATVASGIASVVGVPGRLERVEAGQDFLAVVDYAHKPDAVAAALRALRPLTQRRLIIVLGAGGERDPGKRPLMGEVAARMSDVLIVTDDNPRGEDPAAIRAAICAGAARVAGGQGAEVLDVAGRRDAIARAVSMAAAGDTVLVAGKGHETGQQVSGRVHPFDDREVVRTEVGAR